MFTGEAHWTLPTLIMGPILVILVLICVAIILGAIFYAHSDERWPIIGIVSVILAGIVGLGLYGFWPFKSEYHRWRTITGTVQQMDKRLMTNSDGNLQERYVVVLKETGEPFACDDTRCSLLKVGDPVSLACKKEWEYASTDGWGCRFKSNELTK